MKTMQKLVIAMAALMAMTACDQNDKTKFNAKDYAERKTERLDQIVELSDAQEKEVYSIYLAQGKEIKKNIKACKKECGEIKRPDCKKAECNKAECTKACDKKAECNKACDKTKCEKPCCDKKTECAKAKCEKKGECKPAPRRHRRPDVVTLEMRKATFDKVNTVLTPEQSAKLKEHYAKRRACKPNKQCAPCKAQTK